MIPQNLAAFEAMFVFLLVCKTKSKTQGRKLVNRNQSLEGECDRWGFVTFVENQAYKCPCHAVCMCDSSEDQRCICRLSANGATVFIYSPFFRETGALEARESFARQPSPLRI